jgi:hypothetical protein
MSTTDLLEGFRELSELDRLAFLEAAARLAREDLEEVESARRAVRDERLRKAALAARDLYAPGSEHVEWTCLDGEEFLDDYR